MRREPWVMVLCLASLFPCTCTKLDPPGGGKARPGDAAATPRVFIDRACGYEVSYPSDWKAERYKIADHLIRADIKLNNDAGVQIRVQRNIGASADDFVAAFRRKFVGDMSGRHAASLRELDLKKTSVGGAECTAFSFEMRKNGEAWFLREHVIVRANDAYIFQSGCRLHMRASCEPVFDQIAGSIRFLK